MLENASFLSFYLAFALFHGADGRRFPLRDREPTRGLLRAMRLGAALALASGVALWTHAENLAAALLVGVGALAAAASLFVLLAPLAPRLVWTVAAACPALIAALALLGAKP